MARPYKGNRVGISSKIPEEYFLKFQRYCELTNQSQLDFIAQVVMKEIDRIDIDALEGQEKLPVSA